MSSRLWAPHYWRRHLVYRVALYDWLPAFELLVRSARTRYMAVLPRYEPCGLVRTLLFTKETPI